MKVNLMFFQNSEFNNMFTNSSGGLHISYNKALLRNGLTHMSPSHVCNELNASYSDKYGFKPEVDERIQSLLPEGWVAIGADIYLDGAMNVYINEEGSDMPAPAFIRVRP